LPGSASTTKSDGFTPVWRQLDAHGLGIALALHEAGYVVSIVNPAQIRNFARTKLGRN
jgi:hypothetical protein